MPVRSALPFAVAALATAVPAQLGSLTTTFLDNNGRSTTPPVNLMDMTVLNPAGLRFVAVDVNSMAAVNTPIAIEVYVTPTTYVGNELNASVWTKVSEGRGIAQGRSTPTPVEIRDFTLPPGSYGIGVYYLNGGSAYTGTTNTYGNSDLSLTLGSVTASFFSSTLFTPRTWNGTWYYYIGNACYGTFGQGCAHAGGVPALQPAANSLPRLGSSLTLSLTQLDPTLPALLATGLRNSSWALGPLPCDLALFGAPGCSLLVDPAVYTMVPSSNGSGSFTVGVPNLPGLQGVAIYQQALALVLGVNAMNAVVSNGGEGVIGR